MKNYVTHIVLGNGLSVDLFTPAIFRLRKTEIDDAICQSKYLIPFAVGKVDPWTQVNYTSEKTDCGLSIKTEELLITVDTSDASFTVCSPDGKTRIYPSDRPSYGLIRNGYMLFDSAASVYERNDNSRFAHWFYNPETKRYDVFLKEDKIMDLFFIYGLIMKNCTAVSTD